MSTFIVIIAFFALSINTNQSGFFHENIGKNTPLHLASANNNLEEVKSLLSEKANVNAKNEFGWTPLHYACSKWNVNIEIVKLLVENKADVNAKNNQSWTPLHNAVLQVNLELVKYLLSQGADKNICTLDGKTTLELANQSYPSFGKTKDKQEIISLVKSEQ